MIINLEIDDKLIQEALSLSDNHDYTNYRSLNRIYPTSSKSKKSKVKIS